MSDKVFGPHKNPGTVAAAILYRLSRRHGIEDQFLDEYEVRGR